MYIKLACHKNNVYTYLPTHSFTYLLSYLLNYLLIPWSKVILEKLPCSQLVKNFFSYTSHLTVSFKFINFSFQIFLLFVPEMSTSFPSYIV